MPKIGVVLSGCASKGAYEIGCMKAIEDFFGMDSICCVSASSIGAMIGQLYGMDRKEELLQAFRNMDSGKYGRYILSFTNNKEAMSELEEILSCPNEMLYEHYVTVWNASESKVEYLPFHTMPTEQLKLYMRAAISFPIFTRGMVIDGKRYLDGALLDNIPIYPLIEKDLDYIFCIYFDNNQYIFESAEFDKKVIKLHDFPNQDRLEVLFCEPGSCDRMLDYGYNYTTQLLEKLFADPEKVYEAIELHNATNEPVYKHRLTADVVLSGINVMSKKYGKALSTREKVKAK